MNVERIAGPEPRREPGTGGARSIRTPAFSEEAVREQLRRICSSTPFVRSARISAFLTFVVESTLEGNEDVLKESVLGLQVFGRDAGYDPKIDPIVRVEARRLRSKLQEYYDGEGAGDPCLIALPKGRYRPDIELRELPGLALPQQPDSEPAAQASAPLAPEPAVPHPPAVIRGWKQIRPWHMAAALIPLVLLAGVLLLQHKGHGGKFPDDQPLTYYIGEEFSPTLSPDGHYVAFVWDGDRSDYAIYVKALPNGEPNRVTHGAGQSLWPSWSPDGRDLAFLRVTPNEAEVITVPAAGGAERVVGAVHSIVSVWRADALQVIGSLGPAWSPTGDSIFVDDGGTIEQWPLAYGPRRQITHPQHGANDFFPAVSPDGHWLAFSRQTSNSTSDLFLADLTHPEADPRRLTSDRSDIRGIAWNPNGRELIFSSKRSGNYALWSISQSGSDLRPFPVNSHDAILPATSLHGDRLAYTDFRQNTNIWELSLQPVTEAVPQRIIASSGRNHSAQFSPDGQQIAFISDRTGTWELWVARADGSSPRRLTSFNGPLIGTPHWSPDGRQIAFDARPGDHSAIFVIPASGGQPIHVGDTAAEERMPNWSPDGRWLYLSSTRSGQVRLWKEHPDGTEPTLLSDRPAYDSFEDPLHHTVYFRSEGNGIWAVPASGGTTHLVAGLENVEGIRYLAMTPDAFYFVDHEAEPRHVLAYDLATGAIRPVAQITGTLASGTPSLSVQKDGRTLLFSRQDESSSDIRGTSLDTH